MKVKAFLIFLFIVFVDTAVAQVLVGPTVGVNYSWVTFGDKDQKETYRVKPVIGYSAGFNLSFRVRKRFFLHSSFIYSTKGKIIEAKEESQMLSNKVIYRYLELPLLYTVEFRTKLKGGKEFKWYFGAGPNISYWLGGKGTFFNSELAEKIPAEDINYRISFGKTEFEISENEMGVERPNRIQLGLNLSAGLVFQPMYNQQFMLTVRYELGHSYLSRTKDGSLYSIGQYNDDLQVRNQGFRISLAYLIDLRTDQRKRGKSTFKHKK